MDNPGSFSEESIKPMTQDTLGAIVLLVRFEEKLDPEEQKIFREALQDMGASRKQIEEACDFLMLFIKAHIKARLKGLGLTKEEAIDQIKTKGKLDKKNEQNLH